MRISHTAEGGYRCAPARPTRGTLVAHPNGTMYWINRLRALVCHDRGQDLIEYSLLLALIALTAGLTIQAAGAQINVVLLTIVGFLNV